MRSGVAWLSSSSAEIARARDVLKALTPGGVIDELGFLLLQAPFAEHFYPAVTTPMTRARYLIFIPATYQHLEQSGKAVGKDADRVSRDLQFELLKALLKNEPRAIGMESGRNIVRTPSEIYWNALAALGIATQRLSESSYQNRLSAGALGPKVWRDDDDAAHAGDAESLWSRSLRLTYVMPDGAFPDSTDFRLRKAEAVFLQSQYAGLKPGGHDSLITHMISLAREHRLQGLEGLEHLWDIPALPKETALAVGHARRLSLFARGTTLQYHRMLIEKKGATDTGAAEAFVSWWDYAKDDLDTWDVDAFLVVIQRWNAAPRPRDREFMKDWIARAVAAKSGQQALDDVAARTIIARREDYVRPGKQRLRGGLQLDSWSPLSSYPDDVFFQLEYRHRVGRTFAQDIAEGLDRGAA